MKHTNQGDSIIPVNTEAISQTGKAIRRKVKDSSI
jgi:hypothetical protein